MDRATTNIAAPPEAVYDLLADVTAMGRWSPETHRTEWRDGATGPVPGARFRGWNRADVLGLPLRWSTKAVVRRADRGRTFSFDVPFSGTRWTFRFEPTPDGCRVTETRELIARPLPTRVMTGLFGRRRTPQLQAGMAQTLARVRTAAEAMAEAMAASTADSTATAEP